MGKNLKEYSTSRKFWHKFAFIMGSVVLVIAIALCGITIFQRTYYTPFWVNGQSMYPTLNKDAKYSDGTLIGEVRTRGEEDGIYDVDYGFMITNEKAISNIKRFDIIVCKYKDTQASYNIKRVIALPGETFYIENKPSTEDNGKLYVKNAQGEFEYITQPLDTKIVNGGNYNSIYVAQRTLEANQYFVMGDNRYGGNSYDSRNVGPITKDNILGVVAGLNGKAVIGYSSDGTYGPKSVSHYWPRFL